MRTASDGHPNVPGSCQTLTVAIEAHIAREKLTRTGFGMDPVDDGSFLEPSRPELGRAPRDRRQGARLHGGASEHGGVRCGAGPVEGEAPAVPADAAGEEETAMDGDIRYMKTREAAALLGLSPRTLETYRWRGGGPAFSRFGTSVRYLRSHVLAWAAARRVRSTSDVGPRREK